MNRSLEASPQALHHLKPYLSDDKLCMELTCLHETAEDGSCALADFYKDESEWFTSYDDYHLFYEWCSEEKAVPLREGDVILEVGRELPGSKTQEGDVSWRYAEAYTPSVKRRLRKAEKESSDWGQLHRLQVLVGGKAAFDYRLVCLGHEPYEGDYRCLGEAMTEFSLWNQYVGVDEVTLRDNGIIRIVGLDEETIGWDYLLAS